MQGCNQTQQFFRLLLNVIVSYWIAFTAIIDQCVACACVCVCVCVRTVKSAVSVMYNAALNRPAYLSSVHSARQYSHRYSVTHRYSAHLANDGNYETTGGRPSPPCAISSSEPNPWWAVDLGPPTVVYRVDFTNRNDGHGTYEY